MTDTNGQTQQEFPGLNLAEVARTFITVQLSPQHPTTGRIIFAENPKGVFDAVVDRLGRSPLVKRLGQRTLQIDWTLAAADGQPMSREVRRSLKRKGGTIRPTGYRTTPEDLVTMNEAVKNVALSAAGLAYLRGLPADEVEEIRSRLAG